MIENKKLKFIHVTKCAGTSIESLRNDWGRHDDMLKMVLKKKFPPNVEWWHVPPKWAGFNEINKLKKDYDLFTVVRNPYSRVISEYYCQWGGPKIKADDEIQFNSWISDKLEEILALIDMGERIHGHWCPQYLYVEDDNNELIMDINNNVLKFESLANDFDKLVAKYGSEYNQLSLLKKEYTSNNDSKLIEKRINECKFEKKFNINNLNKRNRKLILKLYKKDFVLFNYDTGEKECEKDIKTSSEVTTTTTTTVTAAVAAIKRKTVNISSNGKRMSLQEMLAQHKSKKLKT